MWKVLRAQGIFRGHGPAPKVAFMYTGQGSQYVNMLRPIRALEPIVADTFAEADRIMAPILGKPLSEYIYVDEADPKAVAKAEEDLRQTAITQPAVLTIDMAMTRLLAAYGIQPDFTMGHSVGEYGALTASEGLPFEDALEAVAARGREMTRVSFKDTGLMAAVFAPLTEVERLLKTVDGYVVIANINSEHQSVIGGSTPAVTQAVDIFQKAGFEVVLLPVSHAFHTSIVAPASEPLRQMLSRLRLQSPRVPIVANIDGEFYPTGPGVVPKMLDMLAHQVAAPVQFIKGLRTLYKAGARIFVEVGPKKALQGFADDVFSGDPDVVSLFTNHPKFGDIASFNQALCGLYAAGLGRGQAEAIREVTAKPAALAAPDFSAAEAKPVLSASTPASTTASTTLGNGDRYLELGHMFADVLERGWQMYHGQNGTDQPVAITGAALGLPGTGHIFDDGNIGRILRGDQFIAAVPAQFRRAMADKHITRLVKNSGGEATFETINDVAEVIKLAGRGGAFDLESEFGVSSERRLALDRTTCLAVAAGIDALRDAGIPLVMRYKTTSKGTQLPERWALPDALRDDTGVIFASAFPGYDSFTGIMSRYYEDHARREQLTLLESVRVRLAEANGHSAVGQELDRRIRELRASIEKEPFVFDRRFLFKVLAMGHSQFAEFIGARGPNTAINAACASTTQGVALAEDWIRAGRCRRVIVISADDVTSDNMMEWFGAGFLASGAAATDDVVEDAAIPFDRRRHGMIIGMGAAALVVESAEAARARGIQPICEVLSAVTANSAFHGTRLDVEHIGQVMENLLAQAEVRCGIRRQQIAPQTVFVSHETYTPARGGSASAEINALRRVFGSAADQIVIANTKGYTGHAMATGIEDVLAVKSLETGLVPPLPNFKEVDPELGALNLSKGGKYPVEYALRLGAGFGSQISMTLLRWVATKDGVRPGPNALGYSYRIADVATWQSWLNRIAQYPTADLEVIHRTLRVRDQGAPARAAEGTPRARVVTMPAPASRPAAFTKPERVVPVAVASAVETGVTATAVLEEPLTATTNGYPIDVFDLDVDTEEDVDGETIMQAEALATIGEANGSTREEVAPPPQKAQPVVIKAPVAPAPEAKEETKLTTPAPVEISAKAGDSVKERILALVVEKTGYPQDMLDLDLDLEADLGVDTVKQAEMFAAVREIYNIPRDESRKLRDYPTLAHVIRFVFEKRPDLAGTTPPATAAAAAAPLAATVAPSPVSTPVAAPAVAQAPTEDSIKEKVLEIVAEKTGYPKDMLDLDLDLEADLGIDTVKQAEMFAAIRAVYGIPRDQDLKLRDFPTLAHVIKFAVDRQPGGIATPAIPIAATGATPPTTAVEAPAPVAAPVVAQAPTEDSIKEKVLEIVAEKTGYPKDMLDLDLDLEADLGIDTVKQAEMFAAIRATYGIPRDQDLKLRDFPTLAHVIKFAVDRRPGAAATPAVTVSAAGAAPPATAVKVPVPLAATVTPPPASSDATAPAPVPSAIAAPTEDSIKDKVLEIVAEKTGYPKDMLDLDLDLEADLGIDTVKQAEMFAAIRATYGIPRDQDLKLRDFPTLAHVIKFAVDRRPGATTTPAATQPEAAAVPPSAPAPVAPRPILASFDAADKIPRRVPVATLRPAPNLCKTTGVTLAAGCRVVIMPDRGGVAEALAGRLQTMGVEVLSIDSTLDADALATRLKSWVAAGPVHGVYWLPALTREPVFTDMDANTWHEALRVRIKLLFTTMRALYEQVATAGTFLVSATRLGGQHGYDAAGAVAPLGGAVTGFTKAYKRERPDVLVKAVDVEAERAPLEVAEILVEEALRDPGAVEIGYQAGQRWTVGVEEQPAADGKPGMTLDKNTVFLITGAAGSIVTAITADLAAASGGTFYLLDLVPEPDPNNPDLKRFANDRDGLKRELFTRIQARGERATPVLVEKELVALERAQAAQSAIEAVRAAGGTARYFSVNLTDSEAVARIIKQVRERSGRIDVLLHAAGMERSHFLPDKESREFDLVFDVKADGFFNLLRAIGGMPLGATVAFSSVAGRFGNGGQTDYSAVNDLLCKISSSFRTTRPATRAIAIDWSAWGGIGMATRGSIAKMMEVAGIDMLSPEAAIPIIRRELTAGGTRGEIVIGKRLGIMLSEFDATGGLDLQAVQASAEKQSQGPMLGKVAGLGVYSGLTIETTLDPKVQPFLHDHQIDGTPVLPGVMGIEAFAEAALWMLPGWHVESVEEMNFLAPFKFYRNEPRTVTVEIILHADGNAVVADCRLIGRRLLHNQAEPQVTTHFTGRVRLARQPLAAMPGSALVAPSGSVFEAADIYRIFFHGPAYQVLERAWCDGNRVVGLMAKGLPANHHPSEKLTVVSPRLIELCLQTAGVWELKTQGWMGLPQQIRQVCLWGIPDRAEGRLYAVVTADPAQKSFDVEVLDEAGKRYARVSGYRTEALPDKVDAESLKKLQAVA
ncbi:MAG: SDR family NAD(P)-dependent oxidoreductase [Terriglobales bacterium]